MTEPATEHAPRGTIAGPGDVRAAADELARGRVVLHGFGTVHALTARPDREGIALVNRLTGRPDGRAGSVTTVPDALPGLFDWTRLPAELPRRQVRSLMDELYELGPFGFRGPAADAVPERLTAVRDGVRTARVVAPGRHCPSNAFLAAALDRAGTGLLCTASADRSRELPPHVRILTHAGDTSARERFPHHAPVPVTVVAFHRAAGYGRAGLPALILERPGSLSAEHLRSVAANHGFALAPAVPRAEARVYAPSVRR
ncbi:hypothetical protein KV205_05360 [Streptomyces sp. SKN60]|uniref:hypothetical protein n=1 Tax=Streptomyces sp. SKN60 TaxID=2855506 RepID=UPI002246F8A7|nr:hypothetical protein [Streptomyces sp. SKN60]MCX2179960.1 hypothetical protein [Streptomyces sp. SKN60]